jgi:hypothetical protein
MRCLYIVLAVLLGPFLLSLLVTVLFLVGYGVILLVLLAAAAVSDGECLIALAALVGIAIIGVLVALPLVGAALELRHIARLGCNL